MRVRVSVGYCFTIQFTAILITLWSCLLSEHYHLKREVDNNTALHSLGNERKGSGYVIHFSTLGLMLYLHENVFVMTTCLLTLI